MFPTKPKNRGPTCSYLGKNPPFWIFVLTTFSGKSARKEIYLPNYRLLSPISLCRFPEKPKNRVPSGSHLGKNPPFWNFVLDSIFFWNSSYIATYLPNFRLLWPVFLCFHGKPKNPPFSQLAQGYIILSWQLCIVGIGGIQWKKTPITFGAGYTYLAPWLWSSEQHTHYNWAML